MPRREKSMYTTAGNDSRANVNVAAVFARGSREHSVSVARLSRDALVVLLEARLKNGVARDVLQASRCCQHV